VSETWSIKVPFHDRSDTLADVAFAANDLPDDDRLVTQHLVLEAHAAGDDRVGHLLDRLGSMSPRERRQVLDDAREASGLERSEDIDSREAFEHRNRTLPRGRDPLGRCYQVCHAEGCTVHPVGPSGEWVPHLAAKWYCEVHRDQAGPGDLDPPDDLMPRIDPATMHVLPSRAEQARLEREAEQLREEDRRRNAAREAEAKTIAAARERYETANPPPPLAGLPGWGRR
jgi:hypothetical protein